jgi:HAD superfamily hydrolase (TIGR01509 family)
MFDAGASGQASPYDAILFDFDGVLADTEPLHWASWAQFLRPLGVELDWATYERCALGLTNMAAVFAALPGCSVTDEEIRSRYPEKRALFLAMAAARPPISEATVALVQSLSGARLVVVTSSNRLEVEPILDQAGILSCFGTLVCGKEAGETKPAPDPYLLAARNLDARRPLVVEDSEAGLESGRAAGFDVLWVPAATQTAEYVRAVLVGAARSDAARS